MAESTGAPNRRIESARAYHDETAHSPASVRASSHRLEWETKPSPFKIYPDRATTPLPREFPVPDRDAFRALIDRVEAPHPLDLEHLAGLLFFSAGITKKRAYPGGGEIYFRAAASTGALYQTEVYVVAGPDLGLRPGVYHFSPGDFALRQLREGDFRAALAGAAADESVARAPATLVLSGIYWRNTWKYQARGYRHLFWDAGTLLANALAAAAALDQPARVVTGFADAAVNELLGLDPDTEGALALAALGAPGVPAGQAPPAPPIAHATVPLSARAVDYPALRAAYRDSRLTSSEEVRRWREPRPALDRPPEPGASSAPRAEADAGARETEALGRPRAEAGRPLGETILARGSTREFSGEAIAANQLADCLYHATRGFPADAPAGIVDLYLSVHAVEGIAPGAYVYHPGAHRLERLRAGDFRRDAAFLCLEQPLGGMSSATVFFLSDLRRVLERFGNRGYRLANLEAGLIGGRLYLGAYAQRLGATGLTFYDRSVVEFFSPHAAGKDAIFVTALGRSVRTRPRAPVLMHPP